MLLLDIVSVVVFVALILIAYMMVEKFCPYKPTLKSMAGQSLLHVWGQWKAQLIFWFGWALVFNVDLTHLVDYDLLFWQYVLLATLKAAGFFAVSHFVIDFIIGKWKMPRTVQVLRWKKRARLIVNALAALLIYFII